MTEYRPACASDKSYDFARSVVVSRLWKSASKFSVVDRFLTCEYRSEKERQRKTMISTPALCDECETNFASHTIRCPGEKTKHLCCRCYVQDGNAPADWHPLCMEAHSRSRRAASFRPAPPTRSEPALRYIDHPSQKASRLTLQRRSSAHGETGLLARHGRTERRRDE